jgi:uracil-DNA glycosylase
MAIPRIHSQIQIKERQATQRALDEFDWMNPQLDPLPSKPSRVLVGFGMRNDLSLAESKLKMLAHLSHTCSACVMCELGSQQVPDGQVLRDPHLLSNLKVSRFFVLGQNPGINELRKSEPFIGEAGKNFDRELVKHGLTRDDFYIANTVRCHTPNNHKPSDKSVERCRPFLHMEINLLRPQLLITLGAVAFAAICPGLRYQDSLGVIVRSDIYDLPVFPVYHPSPLNLADAQRKQDYISQMAEMCGLVSGLKRREAALAARSDTPPPSDSAAPCGAYASPTPDACPAPADSAASPT